MEKILGLDLGTNSIGWAIRDTSAQGNQIIDKGVLTFDKGVGEGKSGEFPLVQKRTESRSKRRNYQAEKYRKWALLETLIEQNMCPLSMSELNEWRKYQKGTSRKYPTSSQFIDWLRFDFDGNGKPDFENFGFSKHENHYLFRALAVSEDVAHKKIFHQNPHILGRVLYHLVQRRGFRGRDEEESKTIMQGSKDSGTIGVDAIVPFIQKHKTLGAALYYLHKEKKEKIRKRYNLRTDYEQELKEICRIQDIDTDVYKKLWKAIIWQRPLRSQKGLVGICSFEKNKPRCPVSHPLYEEYRTWVFINNLKIQLPDNIDRNDYLKEKIYPLFYNASRDFKLSTIQKELNKVGGKIEARFAPDTKVVSCTLLNTFDSLLGVDWKEKYGWNEAMYNQPKNCAYSFEDIWHVLFTFDSREKLYEFAIERLGLTQENAEKLSKIKLQQGYATLSLSAIKKILPFLYQGFIYSEAIYLANLYKVLGEKQITLELAQNFAVITRKIFREQSLQRQLINVVNSLISDQLNSENRFGMDVNYQLDEDDHRDITAKLEAVSGTKSWEEKTTVEKNTAIEFVSEKYLQFLRKPINAKKEGLFLKPERLHNKIFNYLQETYNIPETNIKYLWHPSEQETYLPAKQKNNVFQLGAPQPVSRGFKNPMALKTLHKLKHLLNYLLEAGKIDEDTRIVIEIARELNDANKRKAIEKWQRDREKENETFRKRIQEIAEECKLNLDINNKDIIDKYRLWVEQKFTCLYTGKIINYCDLFDGNKFDFEHTIPASISFDNELKNITVTDGLYNKQVKQNKIPTALPNYYENAIINGIEYTAIKPRLDFIFEKVEHLENLMDEWKNKTKFASSKEIKDACIQRKHLIRFELDYWRKKLDSFTINEYKAGWRNSQLRDTQVVTKYALPYLKTVFSKVEVQKGSITDIFKEIYMVKFRLDEKDRSKHSHHAIDAAILTLIPPAAIRDKILLRYNEVKDANPHDTYHESVRQWKEFQANYILSIEDDVLINFQPNHRTLIPTYKNVRKRGKQQFVKEKLQNGKWQYKLNNEGELIPLIAKGDTIRGQLHKESFFGAIKLNNGNEKWLVERYPIASFTSIADCKHIVDETVKEIVRSTLEKRMSEGQSFEKSKLEPIPFPNGKEVIKKVRCKVAAGRGYLTPEKALEVKKHTFLSKHDYKHFIYAQNEENTICLHYGDEENKTRGFRIVGLFELSGLHLSDYKAISGEKYYQTIEVGRGKNKKELQLNHIIKTGTKVILFKDNVEELKALSLPELLARLYRVYKFNEPAPSTVYVYLQHHLEARPNDILGNGDNEIKFDTYQPRIFLNSTKFTCALEGIHFNIQPDGEIRWLL